jgi:hypothetical protein
MKVVSNSEQQKTAYMAFWKRPNMEVRKGPVVAGVSRERGINRQSSDNF